MGRLKKRWRSQAAGRRALRLGLLLLIILGGAGCQTFTLTKEEWERQKRGECVDPEVGKVVGILGTAGYYGAVAGECISRALK